MTSPAPAFIPPPGAGQSTATPDGSSRPTAASGAPHAAPPPATRAASAKIWAGRIAGFFFTILELCALGALLGAIIFPLVGPWGGLHKSREEMILLGARTGAFFFLVWAPGVALVRAFMRAATLRKRA